MLLTSLAPSPLQGDHPGSSLLTSTHPKIAVFVGFSSRLCAKCVPTGRLLTGIQRQYVSSSDPSAAAGDRRRPWVFRRRDASSAARSVPPDHRAPCCGGGRRLAEIDQARADRTSGTKSSFTHAMTTSAGRPLRFENSMIFLAVALTSSLNACSASGDSTSSRSSNRAVCCGFVSSYGLVLFLGFMTVDEGSTMTDRSSNSRKTQATLKWSRRTL